MIKDDALKLGTAKVDITPDRPIQLAGFAVRNGEIYEGIADRLYARIFYVRQDRDGPCTGTLIVTADLLNWDSVLADELRGELSSRLDMPASSVILHATHSHSGPATMPGVDVGDPDPAYLQRIRRIIVEGACDAVQNPVPVRVERGSGVFDLAYNRRKMVDGRFLNMRDDEGPRDQELTVIRFTDERHRTKAVWLHYTCHPVLSSEKMVSSEYCGIAMDLLEQQLGEGAVVGFMQGACGDINPYLDGNDAGLTAVKEAGSRLAKAAGEILDQSMTAVHPKDVSCRAFAAELPYEHTPSDEELRTLLNEGTALQKKWAALLLEHPERVKPSARFDAVYLKMGEDLGLFFMNGEMVVRYGLYIKERTANNVLPVAYSNGMIGYVTTAKQLEEGGYEPRDSVLYLGVPSPFGTEAEGRIIRLIDEVFGHTPARM